MKSYQTQETAILDRLQAAGGEWVPLPEIMKFAAQYNARIFSLRRSGHLIENRTECVNGERHSWFRLVTPRQESLVQSCTNDAPSRPIGHNGGLLFALPEKRPDYPD